MSSKWWSSEIRLRHVLLSAALGWACGGKSAAVGTAGGAGSSAQTESDGGSSSSENGGAPNGTAATGGGSSTTGGSAGSDGGDSGSTGDGATSGGGSDAGGKGGAADTGGAGSLGGSAAVGGMAGNAGVVMSASGGGGTATGPRAFPCQAPYSWGSNVDLCATGFLHREEQKACPRPPRRATSPKVPVYPELEASCDNDSDCPMDSYCVVDDQPPGEPVIRCKRMCEVDSDCALDEFCICLGYDRTDGVGQDFGVCIRADCKVDSECGGALLCIGDPQPGPCGGRPDFFACQTLEDTCGGYKDCPAGNRCSLVDGRYQCVDPGVCEVAQGAHAP